MEDIGKDTEGIRITWLGTAALKLENKEGTVLIDPFVEMDGAENQNDKEDFLSGDAILITHGHLDHLSLVPVLEVSGECLFTVQRHRSRHYTGME